MNLSSSHSATIYHLSLPFIIDVKSCITMLRSYDCSIALGKRSSHSSCCEQRVCSSLGLNGSSRRPGMSSSLEVGCLVKDLVLCCVIIFMAEAERRYLTFMCPKAFDRTEQRGETVTGVAMEIKRFKSRQDWGQRPRLFLLSLVRDRCSCVCVCVSLHKEEAGPG